MNDNLSAFRVDIPILQLPKTFQDAAEIAGWLEVSHIWIDSLCILQDSPEDWRKESAVMDQIFENSHCTISADRAVNGTIGCFRSDNALQPIQLSLPRVPSLRRFWLVELLGDMKQRLGEEPLARRAWALQEHILSPRILHFGTKELFWKCTETARFQTYFAAVTDDDLGRQKLLWQSNQSAEMNWISWNHTVEEYSRRALTREADKLVALSGIAKRYTSFFGDTYIAGHFKSRLPIDLLWQVSRSSTSRRPATYRAPKWSWASVDGEIELIPAYYHGLKDRGLRRTVFKVLESESDLVGEDLTGQVRGGFLRGLGVLQRARWDGSRYGVVLEEYGLLEPIISMRPESLKRLDSSKTLRFHASFDEPSELDVTQQLHCLPIQWHFNGTQVGLILQGGPQSGHFRRIGLFETSRDPESGHLTTENGKRSEIMAAFKHNFSSTLANTSETAQRWVSLCRRNENWSRKHWDPETRRYRWKNDDDSFADDLSDEFEDGPHFLYERDPDSVDGFERLESQIITIV